MKFAKRAMTAVALLLAGYVAAATPAVAAEPGPPPARPGMTVIEVPAYPGVKGSVPTWIEVPTATRQAATAAKADRSKDLVSKGMPPAPQPPAAVVRPAASKLVTCVPICRHYGRIIEDTDPSDLAYGLQATITTGKPWTQSGANHSLGEIAVQSDDQLDVVEVMWRVNLTARPDGNPVLEAYHWIGGVGQGYRVGFVDYAPNPLNLGAGLPKPVNKDFVISSTSTDFWVGYDGNWVASVPKSRWGARPFGQAADQVKIGQAFYEVAASGAGEEHPCDDMGTGWDSNPFVSGTGSLFNFAWIGSTTAVNVTGGIVTNPAGIAGNADAYHFATTSANSGRGSGPGWDAAGVGAGTKDAC